MQADGRLVIEVADDGIGGADPRRAAACAACSDRVEAVGGSLAITSTTVGTTLRAEFPLGGWQPGTPSRLPGW